MCCFDVGALCVWLCGRVIVAVCVCVCVCVWVYSLGFVRPRQRAGPCDVGRCGRVFVCGRGGRMGGGIFAVRVVFFCLAPRDTGQHSSWLLYRGESRPHTLSRTSRTTHNIPYLYVVQTGAAPCTFMYWWCFTRRIFFAMSLCYRRKCF